MFDLDFKSALEPVIFLGFKGNFFHVKSQCEMSKEKFLVHFSEN